MGLKASLHFIVYMCAWKMAQACMGISIHTCLHLHAELRKLYISIPYSARETAYSSVYIAAPWIPWRNNLYR